MNVRSERNVVHCVLHCRASKFGSWLTALATHLLVLLVLVLVLVLLVLLLLLALLLVLVLLLLLMLLLLMHTVADRASWLQYARYRDGVPRENTAAAA